MKTRQGRRCVRFRDKILQKMNVILPLLIPTNIILFPFWSSSSQWTWAGLVLFFQKKRYHSAGCEPPSKALNTLVQHGKLFVSFLPLLLHSFLTLHLIPIPPFKIFKLLILIIFLFICKDFHLPFYPFFVLVFLLSYVLFFLLASILNTCVGLYPRFMWEARQKEDLGHILVWHLWLFLFFSFPNHIKVAGSIFPSLEECRWHGRLRSLSYMVFKEVCSGSARAHQREVSGNFLRSTDKLSFRVCVLPYDKWQ